MKNLKTDALNLWDSLPNWFQSFLIALLVAALDYGTGEHTFSWGGLFAAVFAAAANYYTSHRSFLLALGVKQVVIKAGTEVTPQTDTDKPAA